MKTTRLSEPIFVAANILYRTAAASASKIAWDPWFAFLDWAPDPIFEAAIDIKSPSKRDDVELVRVVAPPLFSIGSLGAATRLIDMVGRP